MAEMSKNNIKLLILLGALLVFIGIGLALQSQDTLVGCYYNNVPRHYPNITGVLGAPDGTYEAQIIRVFNDSTVQMPLCKSSPGQLHGVWKFDNHIVVFKGYPLIRVGFFNPKFDFPVLETYEINWQIKMFRVTLRNNIIVHVEEVIS